MMISADVQNSPTGRARGRPAGAPGFTVVEVLIALSVLAVAILGIASMTATGHGNVDSAGRMSLALTAATQMLEDVRSLPFNNVSNLNGFDTGNAATLAAIPAANPEYTLAQKWRYALAGPGNGFTFTAAQQAQWASLSMGTTAAALRGQISVVNGATPTTRLVTVTITFPTRWSKITLATVVAQSL